jgi:hypothetical protein
MPTSLKLNLVALGFLFAGALFIARGLAEGKGTMPKGVTAVPLQGYSPPRQRCSWPLAAS